MKKYFSYKIIEAFISLLLKWTCFCEKRLRSLGKRRFCFHRRTGKLDADGKRLSRQHWKVIYADSEEADDANNIASNVFDLQESTVWHTSYSAGKDKFPHQIIIDLGEDKTVGGFEYLPRQEANKPGMIKDFRVYIRTTPFKL
ncbi:MAG: discoidin domain-containing protein [Tannerella sp.]|jgi:beta-galactosidase|nr:discoidin domain-containing protein [Tannerella sp.]